MSTVNIKIILARCITLVFRENQSDNLTTYSEDTISKLLKVFKINDANLPLDQDNRKIIDLKNILLDMLKQPLSESFNRQILLQSVKIACGDVTSLYESIRDNISFNLEGDDLTKFILDLRLELKATLREAELKDYINQANAKLRFEADSIADMDMFMGEMRSKIEEFHQPIDKKDPAIAVTLNFSDHDTTKQQLTTMVEETVGNRILKTGWQAINRMTRGGLRRGQMATIGALKHNNKTGFSWSMLASIALFNNPYDQMIDPKKKPLLIGITLEDEAPKLVGYLYRLLKENLEGILINDEDIKMIDIDEAAKYLRDTLGRNGYEFVLLRVNGTDWSYVDIQNLVLSYEAQGYEIHALLIDYLNMVSKKGCGEGPQGEDICLLFRRVRAFTSIRGIALLTPHQLSSEAQELSRQGKKDLVKIVANESYYAGSKGLGREMDLEFFIYIVHENGVAYLTIARGKHRIVGQTPVKDMFTVLPFNGPDGSVAWDEGKEDSSLSKVGSKRMSDGSEEMPFYDLDEAA